MRGTAKYIVFALLLLHTACMKWEYGLVEELDYSGSKGLFICNEGNFQYGNATLSTVAFHGADGHFSINGATTPSDSQCPRTIFRLRANCLNTI